MQQNKRLGFVGLWPEKAIVQFLVAQIEEARALQPHHLSLCFNAYSDPKSRATFWEYALFLVAQFEALDFSGGGLGQALAHFNPARIFPHADAVLDVVFQAGFKVGR